MGTSKKLQGEIDRVLKKVEESVGVFDSIRNKVYDTDSANQKDKCDADLKKEITKLKRFRDQLNTWIHFSEIKDKKALMDACKIIEREMELFRICEKETKTKSFSKEVLGQPPKRDPKEKAKSETRDWLNNTEDLVDAIFNPNGDLLGLQDVAHLKIPLRKLVMATNNFSKEYLIAKGGFGLVYKAQNAHATIAVKKLDQRFGQGDREFMMEIAMLSAYTHKNLVSLVGFCNEGGEKILVYKHESNGSLDQHLHSKDLTWIQRLQICLDVAQGLKYLHDDIGTQHRILHRDMKSANILLDEYFRAKISDFGLSKIALANVPCTILISEVCGTPGYCDPEYYKRGILTQKSDVYSFGVVMFEVLCGKLVGVSKHLGEPFSSELPQNHYEKGTLDEIIDSNLRNQMSSASLSIFSAIAYQCLKCRGRDRPRMNVVVKELEKALVYQQALFLE